MNQADYFYFSGHGDHSLGSIYGVTASQVMGRWDKDLNTVIIAGCSILDINDYNNNFPDPVQHSKSPGKLWATTGPSILLGYNYEAPEDNQGSTAIINTWISQKGSGEILAWKNANNGNNGRNACAIDSSNYYYYKKIFPLFYQWTSVPKASW